MRKRVSYFHCLAVIFVCAIALSGDWVPAEGLQDRKARVWENREGRKIDATLSYVKDGKVMLKLKSGRDALIPLATLCDRDQEYLKKLGEQGLSFEVKRMPLETKIDKDVKVEERPNSSEGGVPVFLTPHFEFHNDSSVSKAFVKEASRIFEGTYEAVSALPLGIEIKAPEGLTHFKTSFQSDAAFRQTLGNSTTLANPRNVAGVYISKLKTVFVPYSQMGVKRSGSKMSLRKSSDTSTLIHEITHQLMHDWLPIMPLWMAEGLSEYVSAVPYQSGRFDFKNAERGLKEALEKRRVEKRIYLPEPAKFLQMKRGITTSEHYAQAMVYVYYFMHLDRPDAPGASLAAYFHLLKEGRENTQNLITEFNKAVTDYNAQINSYNTALDDFRKKVKFYQQELDEFNARIRKHNDLVKQGIDPEGKVKVGKEPDPPKPPVEPVVPGILKKLSPKKDTDSAPKTEEVNPLFDIYQVANDKAFPSLMRGRDFDALKADMIKAFDEIGLDVTFK